MTIAEITSFLLPSGDLIQVIFGGAILFFSSVTVISMFWGARPVNWEKKWTGSGADDLDVEHVSVNEISAAVATKGEKLADIMPGVLLIVGLLGTFLGLGIALDNASEILSNPNMNESMTKLMGMMEGLGTKFKTSTWGLIAFLLIKCFASVSNYDERRLRWCIGKMKLAFKRERQTILESQEREQKALLTTLSKIDQTLLDQLQANRKVLELHVQVSKDGIQSVNAALECSRQTMDGVQQALGTQLQTLNATGLDACRSLNEAKILLQQQSEQGHMQLEDSKAIRSNFESFISANRSNLSALSDAANQMAVAAGGIGQSADQLNTAIDTFKLSVGDVLDNLTRSLAGTIDNMGKSFSHNMSNISDTMANATAGISNAVSNLSESVGETMSSVQQSNQSSIEIQKKAQNEFLVTSSLLSEQVVGMTTLVTDLRESILSGLRAVSENGRRMVSLDKRYSDVVEKAASSAEAMGQISEKLKDMQLVSPLQPAVDLLNKQVNSLGSNLISIDKNIHSFKAALSVSDNSKNIGFIHEAMSEVIAHLIHIDSQLTVNGLDTENA